MDENHIPDAARLNLAFDSRGTVWLKDVELVYVPAEPAQDLERLQGAWLITSFETGGRAVQGAKGDTLTIDTDKFLLAPKTELMKGTLKLDATREPKTIDLNVTAHEGGKGGVALGLYV